MRYRALASHSCRAVVTDFWWCGYSTGPLRFMHRRMSALYNDIGARDATTSGVFLDLFLVGALILYFLLDCRT